MRFFLEYLIHIFTCGVTYLLLAFNKISMALPQADDQITDDEIFFGKLSLRELKKHIMWNKHPPSKPTEHKSNKVRHSRSLNIESASDDVDQNTSFKIIESHSQPNLTSVRDRYSMVSTESGSPCWEAKTSEDSFLKIEDMVTKLCLSPKEKAVELNNTLDVIEYILNNGPDHKREKSNNNEANDDNYLDAKLLQSPTISTRYNDVKPSTSNYESPKSTNKPDSSPTDDSPCYFTPAKNDIKTVHTDVFATPLPDLKPKLPIFKTPAPLSQKKPMTTPLRKTPGKTNAYQHISSPIASYIKNCPQVPLVKDVHPKKPLPGGSSIPKLVKGSSVCKVNKENIKLPSVAYRSAKQTKVINLPDEEKLPQSQWAKKMTSTLQKPVVMKHDHREMNIGRKPLLPQQEDSFADLSYHQAELSVCTQKSAFKMKKCI